MKVEFDLRELAAQCQSPKRTVRKKAVSELTSKLDSPVALEVLNNNNSANSVNWDILFNSAHRAIILESECWKADESKGACSANVHTSRENAKVPFIALADTILKKANASSLKIQCSNILDVCFRVFSDSYLTRNVGPTYISMLRDSVLPERKYRVRLSSEHWDDLFGYLLKFLKTSDASLKEWVVHSAFELMHSVVLYGCQQSHLGIRVKSELLPLLEAKFVTLFDKPALQEALLSLTLRTCVSVAKESRTAVCHLGELVLPKVLSMYEPRDDDTSSRNNSVTEFLLLQVQCHHPKGAKQGSGAAYACDWKIWNSQMRNTYRVIFDTILKRQKIQEHKPFSDSLLDLCVELCYQLFNKSNAAYEASLAMNETNDPDQGPAAKRRKWVTGTEELFEELQACKKEVSFWPLISLVARILEKYSCLFGNAELYQLLEILSDIQCNHNSQEAVKYVYKCLETLVKVMTDKGLSSDLWLKVWDTAVRAAGLNQNESHPLLQALMKRKIVPASAQESLLRVYQSRMIRLTNDSLRTLMTLLSYYHLPETPSSIESTNQFAPWELPISSARVHLLEWLCSVSLDVGIDFQMLGEVLVILMVKVKHHLSDSLSGENANHTDLKRTSVDTDYCTSAFEGGLLQPAETQTLNCQIPLSASTHSAFVDSISQKKLEHLLELRCDELEQKVLKITETSSLNIKKPSKLKADLTCDIAHYASLVANVVSFMMKYGVLSDERLSDYCLKERLKETMESMKKMVPEILKGGGVPDDVQKTIQVLQSLLGLFANGLMPKLSHLLCSLTPSEVIVPVVQLFEELPRKFVKELTVNNAILKIPQEGPLPFASDGNILSVIQTDVDLIRFYCLNILTLVACPKQSLERNRKHKTLLERVFFILNNGDISDLSTEATFMMAYQSVATVLKCRYLEGTLSQVAVKFVKSLCSMWSVDAEASSYIMVLLKEIFKIAAADDRKWERVSGILLLTPFKNKKFGPNFTIQLISCFEELLKVDIDSKWARWSNASDLQNAVDCDTVPKEALVKFEDVDGKVAVVEEIIFFLLNPFHEVRLAAVPAVASLLHGHHHTLPWMQTMFHRISVVLYDMFIVKGADMSKEETMDEGSNRTASVLHVLAAVLVGSVNFQHKALLLCLRLLKEKNLEINLVKKVFDSLAGPMKTHSVKRFLEKSLPFLLNEWFRWGYEFEDFPIRLIHAATHRDFISRFKHIILPIIWKNEKQHHLMNSICKEVQSSPHDIFEACFASIYAQHLAYLFNSDESSFAKAARKQFSSFESSVGKDKMKELISNNIDGVLVELSNLVWDPDHHEELLGLRPESVIPSQPHLSRDNFTSALHHLQAAFGAELDLLVHIGQNQPIIIQSVLLRLREDISSAVTVQQKLKSLHSYSIFAHAIAFHLERNEFSRIGYFLLCDMTHTLLYLIRENEPDSEMHEVCLGSCSFLHVLFDHLLPVCAPAASVLLPTIVSFLIPLTSGRKELSKKSLRLLKLLVVDNSACLKDAIGHLPPFPETLQYEEIQKTRNNLKYQDTVFTLEDEIKHFLSSAGDNSASLANQNSMLDGLRFLRKQLHDEKGQLSNLYKDLELIRGFTKDCKESVLHQLTCRLISLTSAADSKVQLEASCCLGELGAADLTTLVLRPVEGCIKLVEGYSSAMTCVMALAAQILTGYLLDHDVEVVKTASSALQSLLACPGAVALHSEAESERYALNVIDSRKISPFIPKKPFKKNPSLRDSRGVVNLLCDEKIWNPIEDVHHEEWVTNLACSLLTSLSDDDVFKDLASVCKVKPSFAEEMLPVLFYLGLDYSDDVSVVLCTRLKRFFGNHCSNLKTNSQISGVSSDSSSVFLNKASVQCLLNVVNFVRLQLSAVGNKRSYLNLHYDQLAIAAQFCGAYLSSIMYLELWCNGEDRPANFDGSSISLVDFITDSEDNHDNGILLQRLLAKAYEQIGDSDALYGCGSAMLLDPRTRVNQFEYTGKWDKVLLNYDAKLPYAKDRDAANGLANGLYNSSLFNLLNVFIDSIPTEQKEQLLPAQLECMWRLGQWNKTLSSSTDVENFECKQYLALQAIHDGDQSSAQEFVSEGRLSVLKELAHCSLENCKNIYRPLSKLQALQEIESFVTSNDIFNTIDMWRDQDSLPCHSFLLLEPILAQRAKLIETVIFQKNRSAMEETPLLLQKLTQHYLETAELARKEDKLNIAEHWLHSLSVMPHLSDENKRQLRYEEAQLAWSCSKNLATSSSLMARQLLKSLLNELNGSKKGSAKQSKLLPQALILYGKWMAEARSENPQQIIEDYLHKALESLKELSSYDSLNEQIDAHCCLAHFADLEYQRITAYIKSESFQTKKERMQELRSDAQSAESVKPEKEIIDEHRKAVTVTLKVSVIDEGEMTNTYDNQNKFVTLAMRHYLRSVKLGTVSSFPVFRMVSLWLENASHVGVNKQVIDHLDTIQSYKFAELLPQLAARIGNNMTDSFTQTLYNLLKRCCIDHPHHTIPLILALANSYEDSEGKPDPEPRVLGAKQLYKDLSKMKSMAGILTEMDRLSKALIKLAYAKIPDKKTANGYSIPSNENIHKMCNLEHTMLPIINLPVQSDARYMNIIGVHKFESTYTLAGGINRPKKIMCIGSDGIKRPMLVKGRDDLRQDAVMQQVFTILNKLLRTCPETKCGRLQIRTYKIVPLSQRCGVLQWCENTFPVGDILRKMHSTYYPKDWKGEACSKKIENARSKSDGERLSVFKDICRNFNPSFRFFFTENFPNPAEWFDYRMAYIHSVATNSMVGYILGLGDRHISNILMDQSTAELIHIDFGIAFDQGKVLPTPETVPFRLTRDFVDGMGVCGVEGVFRRSCEKTMTVLRKNQEIILTILEVLLYDPLYAWTITPKVADRRQGKANSSRASIASVSDDGNDSSTKRNKMAERVLCRLKEKLQGTEAGPVSSIEGQVNRLIQEARDLGNLSRLFRGWQAYH